jgi:hypothetical protein
MPWHLEAGDILDDDPIYGLPVQLTAADGIWQSDGANRASVADTHYVLAGRDHPAMMPNLPDESTVLTWTRPVPGPGELPDPDLGMSNVSPPLERVWTVEKRDEKRG